MENLAKGYGDRTLFRGLTFDPPGQAGRDRRQRHGQIDADEDHHRRRDGGHGLHGARVDGQLRFLDQSRTVLDDDISVFDNITDGNEQLPFGSTVIDSRAYVARFNFRGEDQQRKVGGAQVG